MSERVLRPRLARRLPGLVVCAVLLVASLVLLGAVPALGVVALVIVLAATVNAALRLFHPLAYATELDAAGFRTHDVLGRTVHAIAWHDVAYLTVYHKDAWFWVTTVRVLAWRCEPRARRGGRRRWVRGGRNFLAEEFDGALPDPYAGIEPTLALFKAYVEAARGTAPVPGLSAGIGP